LPLLYKLKADSFFKVEIIAFGTHLSKLHGFTINEIEQEGFTKVHKISTLISNDDEQSIATSYALTTLKFSDFWAHNKYDLVLCLGDRFEMSAAVQASVPFGIKLAHIHGGETTLGAIDNIYRHQITLASLLHFTSSIIYEKKIASLTGENKNIFTVGSLSLDNLMSFNPIEKKVFYSKFNITENDFALITFHPETVAISKNEQFASEMKDALTEISKKLILVITMPNADTLGSVFRKKIEELQAENTNRIILIENFGKENYFSAMFHAKILIGNTSSGILEAASFGKYVVNVGDRQKGRAQSLNILDANFTSESIILNAQKAIDLGHFNLENIYYKKGAADSIIKVIKNL
jgi:GDP/UDP-N,N'-diacetylbacillosamine 2-epimerase (hydrolysing)